MTEATSASPSRPRWGIGCEKFLYELKAGPAGGRLRRPPSRRQRRGGHRGAGLTLHQRACFVHRID
jgi:hypothetical protein